jgi:hypothetical protein
MAIFYADWRVPRQRNRLSRNLIPGEQAIMSRLVAARRHARQAGAAATQLKGQHSPKEEEQP